MLAPLAALPGHGARVWHVCWHPTLPLLASCGEDRTVRVWSPTPAADAPAGPAPLLASSWQCIHTLEDFSTRTVRTCEWSPCGRFLAATSFDSNTTVWRAGGSSLAAGAQAGVLARGGVAASELTLDVLSILDGHENEVKGCSWSASGELLATCGRDKSVWLWEAVEEGSDFECIAVLHGHEQDVKSLAWHPSKDLLASVSYDDSVRLWGEGGEDWVLVQELKRAHDSTVWACAWDGAGRHLASVGDDGALRVWAAADAPGAEGVGEAVRLAPAAHHPRAHTRTAFGVHWAGAGVAWREEGMEQAQPLLATCGADDALRVFSLAAGTAAAAGEGSAGVVVLRGEVAAAHAGDVNAVRWHPSLPLLASGGDDHMVRLWRWAL